MLMKTRTYKILLVVVMLLQVVIAGVLAVGLQAKQNDEQAALLNLTTDLLKYHAILGDLELNVAAGNRVQNTEPYQLIRVAVYNDLDRLVEMNKNHPERVDVYSEQRKAFQASERVLETLRDTANRREGNDRWAVLIVMLSGMRRLDKIAHVLHDGIEQMATTLPKQNSGSGPLPIIAIVCSVLSIGVAGLFLVKSPTSF
jgi:hypothetical protein